MDEIDTYYKGALVHMVVVQFHQLLIMEETMETRKEIINIENI